MINVTNYARKRNTGTGNGNGTNTNVYYGGIQGHYLWGNYFDATQDIDGDINAVGRKITCALLSADTINTNLVNAQSGNTVNARIKDLTVTGTTQLKQLNVSENATFDGYTTFNELATFDNDVEIEGNLTVHTDAAIDMDLYVDGDTFLCDAYTDNIYNENDITTKNLTVTGSAHFFELVIDKIKAAGGAVILSPADGFVIEELYQYSTYYRLYFLAEDKGKSIANMWQQYDQAICQSFNQAVEGTGHNVSNKYYWCLVNNVSETPVTRNINGVSKKCHWIDISTVTCDGTVNPEVGDNVAMLGSRGQDRERASAIYISCYNSIDSGLTAPLIAQYTGIDDFSLSSHRRSYFDSESAQFIGTFKVVTNAAGSTSDLDDYIANVMGADYKLNVNCAAIRRDTNGINTPSAVTVSATKKEGGEVQALSKLGDNRLRITYSTIGSSAQTAFAGYTTTLPRTKTITDATGVTFTLWQKQSSTTTFDPLDDIVLDTITVPVLSDGANGQDGEDGQDGSGVSGEFDILNFDIKEAIVDAGGNVNVHVAGKAQHIIGSTIQSAWTWNSYKVQLFIDDSSSGYGFALLNLHPTTGAFSYIGTPITDYYEREPQPVSIIYDFVKGNGTRVKDAFPITFAGNTILDVTDDHIGMAVQGYDGRITQLEATATGLTTTVNNLSTSVSNVQQQADNITSTVRNIRVGADNLVKRTSNISKDWVFGEGDYIDEAGGVWEYNEYNLTGSANTYVYDELKDGNNYPYEDGYKAFRTDSRNGVSDFDYNTDNSKYISFSQRLAHEINDEMVIRLKPNAWYTLSFNTRGWAKADRATTIITKIHNAKQGTPYNTIYVDGVESTNTSLDNIHEWPVGWNLTPHSYTFKTGSLMGQNDELPTLEFIITENALAAISCVQLGEGTVPNKWQESSLDTDFYMSEIRQEADRISLNVYNINNQLEQTGIDITNNLITITSDNTVFEGDINMNNPNDGFIMRDENGQPVIVMVNGEVAKAGERRIQSQTQTGTVSSHLTTVTVAYTDSNSFNLGAFLQGQTIKIAPFYTLFNFTPYGGTTPSAITATAQITVKNSSGTTIYSQTHTLTRNASVSSNYSLQSPIYVTPAMSDTYTMEVTLNFTSTNSSAYFWGTYSNYLYFRSQARADIYQAIGKDGATFKADETTQLKVEEGEITIQQGEDNILKFADGHILRTDLWEESRGVATAFGDISSTLPSYQTTTDELLYLQNYDGLITVNGSNVRLILKESGIPRGKVYYVFVADPYASGYIWRETYNQRMYYNGAEETDIALQPFHLYTIIAYDGMGNYVVKD